MLVRNVPQRGTVALVGDLFLHERDENDYVKFAVEPEEQRANRRKVVCLANFILPGHGPMFAVSALMKAQAGCGAFTFSANLVPGSYSNTWG